MVFKFIKAGFEKVKAALSHTSAKLTSKIQSFFSRPMDPEMLEGLEEILYEADLGVQAASELTQKLIVLYRKNPHLTSSELLEALKSEMLAALKDTSPKALTTAEEPRVILIVGVNGNGKTTSVAKLAHYYKNSGQNVLVAATDTFRAAGIEQLELWASRVNVDIVKGVHGSDPAAVAFDACTAAKARNANTLIIDTAGRLHTKTHLMQELEKIRKTCAKVIQGAPHETWLVIDATTGQNAIDQAKIFHHFTPLTGLILTKLDGSAKGGIVFQIAKVIKTPIQFVGVGESVDDLVPFNAEEYVQALFQE